LLTIRQRSMLSGFHYEVMSEGETLLAELVWPNYVQARNARLKWHKPGSPDGDLKILMPQGDYRIGFEFLTRAFANDLRFFLQQGDDVQAMAEVIFPKDGIKRHEVFLRQPMQARLLRANRWTRVRYRVEADGNVIGSIEEPHWISMKRQLRIDLPNDMPVPLQTFLAFLVINSAFR